MLTIPSRAQVEGNVRTWNEDGRDFIRQSVLRVWDNPFPEYVAPLSSRERSRRARADREARSAAAKSAAPADSPAATSTPTPPSSESKTLTPASDASAVPIGKLRRLPNHYIMNLPASALTFLDAFRGLYRPLYEKIGEEAAKKAIAEAGGLPIVHCYCFTKEIEGAEEDICQVRQIALPQRIPDPN